ncbi:hypothetical protein QC761_0060040 [Podospora bellae-mahoneyi]|uniref:Uncharacterized protein n=1 Tax=Podospora bellae-mahoneyi TaxID=2093777 RepID=A0ABR0FPW2_9PEZI|nr:hypothetical protein QC761_0060040 [Podospora bellae-mahoneyi]
MAACCHWAWYTQELYEDRRTVETKKGACMYPNGRGGGGEKKETDRTWSDHPYENEAVVGCFARTVPSPPRSAQK